MNAQWTWLRLSLRWVMLAALICCVFGGTLSSCGPSQEKVEEAQDAQARATAQKILTNCFGVDFIREVTPSGGVLLVRAGSRFTSMTQGDIVALSAALNVVGRTTQTFSVAVCESTSGRVFSAFRCDTIPPSRVATGTAYVQAHADLPPTNRPLIEAGRPEDTELHDRSRADHHHRQVLDARSALWSHRYAGVPARVC